MAKSSFLIAIAGNVGVGKSTLSKTLAIRWNGIIAEEPFKTNVFLKNFYQDPKKWAFHSQIFFLSSRAKLLKSMKNLNGKIIIFDRTIYEDAEIFASLNLSKREYKIYYDIYEILIETMPKPDYVVYLKASVRTLADRINRRGRIFEKRIKKSYLKRLNQKYDEWAKNFKLSPILTIDTDNLELFSIFNDYDIIIKSIEDFIGYRGV